MSTMISKTRVEALLFDKFQGMTFQSRCSKTILFRRMSASFVWQKGDQLIGYDRKIKDGVLKALVQIRMLEGVICLQSWLAHSIR